MRLVHSMRSVLAERLGIDVRRSRTPLEDAWRGLVNARDVAQAGSGEDSDFLRFCLKNAHRSSSQLMQDLFVLYVTGERRAGFFIEFGATNGVELSNTLLLETEYGWDGLLAEPARGWHTALNANRQCMIDTRCITERSGDTVIFNQTVDMTLSTIDHYSSTDYHADSRKSGDRYEVQTISLNELLEERGAPTQIDYLSADTEGSELAILGALDFGRFRPSVITVEHNFEAAARSGLFDLLTGQGYTRKFEHLSRFDDWYVSR